MKEFGLIKAEDLYRSFLQTTEEPESHNLLTSLITEHADPVIKEIIGYKLRASFDGASDAQESGDIYNNVVISLLTRLRAFKLQAEDHQISDFRGYVATVTYNACANHLREKYPQRHILKNRLRYFLTHEAGFALWEDNQWMCGFSVWQATGKPASNFHKLQTLRDKLRGALPTSLLIEDLSRAKLKALLTTLFNQLEQPIELDELVRLIAEVCGLKDKVAQNNRESTSVDSLELLPDARADIEKEFERRVYLQKLWAEICQLPEKQRAALLLNLKDAQGGCGIAFFPLTGIANFRQLAQALALSAEELAEVWHHLPLDDLTIAARLAVTRQQVINLRKSARERLARRLNDY